MITYQWKEGGSVVMRVANNDCAPPLWRGFGELGEMIAYKDE
jgi:hypothetical protein